MLHEMVASGIVSAAEELPKSPSQLACKDDGQMEEQTQSITNR